jgi:hypothetical protein
MPTAPYARVLVSLNGGPPQRSGITANFGDAVQLFAESTIGWSIPAAVWEITTYPSGWPPPQGWSVDPTTKAYFILGNLSSLPPFQLPGASTGLWGKWKFRLRVNGGGGALTDWSTAVQIVSPHGVHDLASSEGSEFGAERGWPGAQQQNLRLLDQAVAGAGSTLASIGVTAPLVSTGPPNAPVLGIAPVSDTADGAMLHQDKARLDAATSNPVPGTLVVRDSVGGAAFQALLLEAGIGFPAAGLLTGTTGLTLATGGATLALTPAALALAVPAIQVANAQAAPVGNPPSGVFLFADVGAWKARSAVGAVATMAPAGTPGLTLQLLDLVTASVKTADSTSQVLLAYTVPGNVLLELDVSIQARNPANGFGSWFRRLIRVKRAMGAPVLKPIVTPAPDDDETGGLAVTAVLNGANVELHVAGIAGMNLVWFAVARVHAFAP